MGRLGALLSAFPGPPPANTLPSRESVPDPGFPNRNRRPLAPHTPHPATVSCQVFLSQVAEVVDFKTRPQSVSSRLFPGFCQPCCSSWSVPGKLWLEPDANRPKFLLPGPANQGLPWGRVTSSGLRARAQPSAASLAAVAVGGLGCIPESEGRALWLSISEDAGLQGP